MLQKNLTFLQSVCMSYNYFDNLQTKFLDPYLTKFLDVFDPSAKPCRNKSVSEDEVTTLSVFAAAEGERREKEREGKE